MEIRNKIYLYLILFLSIGLIMGKISEVDKYFYFLIAFIPATAILTCMITNLFYDKRLNTNVLLGETARKK